MPKRYPISPAIKLMHVIQASSDPSYKFSANKLLMHSGPTIFATGDEGVQLLVYNTPESK